MWEFESGSMRMSFPSCGPSYTQLLCGPDLSISTGAFEYVRVEDIDAESANYTTDYNPGRPWALAWKKSVLGDAWWRKEFEYMALFRVGKAITLGGLGGGVPVGSVCWSRR